MAYEKQTWEDRPSKKTPASAARFNHMELGIADAHEQLDTRLSPEELSATIAAASTAVYGPRWVFDGDSITVGSIFTLAGNQDRAGSWTTEMARKSLGRILYLKNTAVAGATSTARLAAFDADVAPTSPDVVMLAIGANDVVQLSEATWLSNLDAYLAKCRNIGARLIVGAIWPTDQTSVSPTRGATARAWNDSLRVWAATNRVDVVPFDRLADPATGGWPTGWSTDQIHPGGLDSLSMIGQFAWSYIEPKVGPAVVPRPRCQGDGLFSNGFFLNLTSGIDGGAVQTATTVAATSGSLPAGDYVYRVTARTHYGESGQYVDKSITLASAGGVTVTRVINNYYNAWSVYRKGPGDTSFRHVATIPNGTATWTDGGTASLGHVYAGGNSSIVPVGLTTAIGSSSYHSIAHGGPILTDPAVRGNVLRLAPYVNSSADTSDFFEVTGLTPGQVLDFSCLARSSGAAGYGQIILRWRSASAAIAQTAAAKSPMTGDFGLLYLRATVPAGASRVRISIEVQSTCEYVDVAEVYLR